MNNINLLNSDPKAKSAYDVYKRIQYLKLHTALHKKDKHSIFGLIKINKRFIKLVKFLVKQDPEKYGFLKNYL